MNKAKLKKKLIGKNVSAYTMIEKEIAVMKKMAHPNICKLLEVIDDDTNCNKLYLIMEYVRKTSVNSNNFWKNEKAFILRNGVQLITIEKL